MPTGHKLPLATSTLKARAERLESAADNASTEAIRRTLLSMLAETEAQIERRETLARTIRDNVHFDRANFERGGYQRVRGVAA